MTVHYLFIISLYFHWYWPLTVTFRLFHYLPFRTLHDCCYANVVDLLCRRTVITRCCSVTLFCCLSCCSNCLTTFTAPADFDITVSAIVSIPRAFLNRCCRLPPTLTLRWPVFHLPFWSRQIVYPTYCLVRYYPEHWCYLIHVPYLTLFMIVSAIDDIVGDVSLPAVEPFRRGGGVLLFRYYLHDYDDIGRYCWTFIVVGDDFTCSDYLFLDAFPVRRTTKPRSVNCFADQATWFCWCIWWAMPWPDLTTITCWTNYLPITDDVLAFYDVDIVVCCWRQFPNLDLFYCFIGIDWTIDITVLLTCRCSHTCPTIWRLTKRFPFTVLPIVVIYLPFDCLFVSTYWFSACLPTIMTSTICC